MAGKRREAYGEKKSFVQYFRDLQVVDYRVIVSVVFLMMFGFLMIYSATNGESGASVVLKQIGIGLAGILLMIAASYIDYHLLARWAGAFYLLSLAAIFLVRVPGLGVTINGASRWIMIGGFRFQPSELSKPAIIILTAFLLTDMGRNLRKVRGMIAALLPGVISSGLIYSVTRNLSTALIVAGITVFMFYVAFPNKKIYALIVICLIAVVVLGWFYYQNVIVQEHASGTSFRTLRILAWLYPNDYLDSSMQSRYALYAIGFGGVLGRGLGHGVMKYYIPEAENDFIFSVIGEELGLVGCAMVIFLFIYQIWRIMVISRHATDKLGTYMAFGVGAHVALQVLLHIGVVTSLIPNTGISLPYISYGGTALLLQLVEIGIVLNISKQIPGKKIVIQGMGENAETRAEQERKTKVA